MIWLNIKVMSKMTAVINKDNKSQQSDNIKDKSVDTDNKKQKGTKKKLKEEDPDDVTILKVQNNSKKNITKQEESEDGSSDVGDLKKDSKDKNNTETPIKKTQRETKADKFKDERETIFNRIKEIIKYDEDKHFFTSNDVNEKDVVKEIKEKLHKKIKLFFHNSVWIRVDMDEENSHFCIVRNIFRDFGLVVVSKKNYSKNEDGSRKVWYQHAVIEKMTI